MRQRYSDTDLERENALSEKIIGCAIEVHRVAGMGLKEKDYETTLCLELDAAGIRYKRQLETPFVYRGRKVSNYRIDLVVEDLVVVEVKSVERFHLSHEGKLLSYLRRTGRKLGLLLNFQVRYLKDGIKRLLL